MNKEECLEFLEKHSKYKEEEVNQRQCGICKDYFPNIVRRYDNAYMVDVAICQECLVAYNAWIYTIVKEENILQSYIEVAKEAPGLTLNERIELLNDTIPKLHKVRIHIQKQVNYYVKTCGHLTDFNKIDI